MSVMSLVRNKIEKIEPGKVIRYSDFKIPSEKFETLAKALSFLNKEGMIKRLSKGIYYKPKQTRFGTIGPSENEIISKFLWKDNKINGYITGVNTYNRLGLTTQLSNEIVIASNSSKRKIKFKQYTIKFINSYGKIEQDNINNLQLLDAIKDIKTIPDSSVDNSCKIIFNKINNMSTEERNNLYKLSFDYNPATRALLGAILELIEGSEYTKKLRKTLNNITSYKIGINQEIIPNKKNWNIQ